MARIKILNDNTACVKNDDGSEFIFIDRIKSIRELGAVPTEAVEWYNRVMRNDNRVYDWDKVVRMWVKSKAPKDNSKKYLTLQQAIDLLPDSEYVHTFYNNPVVGLFGADWDKNDVIKKMKSSQRLELTGETARKMGHGVCAYNDGARQDDILFIETDKDKLDAFDPMGDDDD